ncbi:MAG TPA: polyprenol phosphomannose-dependent alpha 1,6 mannosyltransferase MptB, partial [Acidimicrobiales bacterium]|nr:polyprenol phosphomannose-dependent alpha 1,6 mannosyltransferase MptB [Acidimicrobiales bacterium]
VATQPKGVTGPDLGATAPPSAPPPLRLPDADAPRSARQLLRTLLLGPVPGEPVSTHVPVNEEPAPEPAPSRLARYGRFAPAAVVGFVGSLLIVASAPVYYLAEPTWRLTLPLVPHPGSSANSITTFVIGLALMVGGWLLLVRRVDRAPTGPRGRTVAVLVVGALWCLPILASTPLLSHDAYSYAAQGEMASQHIDPTSTGPEALRYGWYLRQADHIWHWAPAPYGPVAIEAEKLVVQATHHVASASVWGMRVVALLGIVMAAAGVALIAASCRRSVALALALGILNPLVLLHLLGGSHNDALMLGFLALGFAAFVRDRRWLAVVLVAFAAGVKLTAAPALVFMAWNWQDDPAVAYARRVRRSAIVVAAAAAVITGLSVLAGVGPGWVAALKSTGQSVSTYSLPTKGAYVATDMLQWVGVHASTSAMIAGFRLVGLAVAGAISFVLLLRSPRLGVVRAFALSSLVIVILGPVVWPWYLATGFALLAATGVERWRPTYIVLVVTATALVWPAGISPLASVQHVQNGISPFVVALVVGVCWAGQRLAARGRSADRPGEGHAREAEPFSSPDRDAEPAAT